LSLSRPANPAAGQTTFRGMYSRNAANIQETRAKIQVLFIKTS
jgi:hypothetical protein